jgi:hypothetical protein
MKRRVDGGVMGIERVRIGDSARVVGGFFCVWLVFVGEALCTIIIDCLRRPRRLVLGWSLSLG